jgi:alcohol dehydrogenase
VAGAFRAPTRVRIAPGCAREAGAVCRELQARHVLLVHDPGLLGTPGLATVRDSLSAAGLAASVASELESNPRTSTAEALGARARTEGCDVVLGLGGGSALDAAKAAAMLATNPGTAQDYVGRNRYPHRPLPFVAVPTTCGTGSEVTWVAVLSAPAARRKVSVKGESMFPAWALVDADLAASLPARVVAWSALDALTHALEAYTCRLANPVSDALAERAAALVFAHLRAAHADVAGARASREALMEAATLAGLAFGNADVAAVHCLSETIGGRWDVPHGLANALLLEPVMRYHLPVVAPTLARLAPAAGVAEARADDDARAEAVLQAVARLARDVDIPPFASLGIGAEHFDWIAAEAEANGSNAANPQAMTAARYREVLDALAARAAATRS